MLDILQKNIDITHLSNYKTPALARWYFELNTLSDISKLWLLFDQAEEKSEDMDLEDLVLTPNKDGVRSVMEMEPKK